MQVAVADMPEYQERCVRQNRLDFRLKLCKEVGHFVDRHTYVEIGIVPYHGHGIAHAVPYGPDGLSLAFRFTDHGIYYPPRLQLVRQGIFQNTLAGFITDFG